MSNALKDLLLPDELPVLAVLYIEVDRWDRFGELTGDAVEFRVLKHEPCGGGCHRVYVACADEIVQKKLEDAWA